MRELYINNQICDIDGDFNPTFQYKSFLFAKMQGYEAARTWEVSIPLTARNRAIIQQSQSADSTSTFPYTTHTVSYYSEGYPIVENGRAYMVGTGSGRARFVFVLGETIKALKELGEKKLNEMEEESTDYLNWDRSIDLNDMSLGFGWVNWFSFTNQDRTVTGVNSDLPYSTLHPVITLDYIMNKIQAFFGLTFVGFGSLLSGCGFPLSKNDGVSELFTNVEDSISINTININNELTYVPHLGITITEGFNKDIKINPSAFENGTANIKVYGSVYTEEEFALTLYKNTEIIGIASSVDLGDAYLFTFDFNVQMNSADIVYLVFDSATTISPLYLSFVKTRNIDKYGQAFYFSKFPIIPNLPDITCAEFINQCCMLTGLFPYVDPATPSVVNFYSVADLYTNKANAQDWSKYLIKESDYMSEGEDIEYVLDGFSQRNTMNHASDPTNQLDTSGLITVSNTNIEYESELFRLFFAAGRRVSLFNAIVDYPLYDVSIKDGALIRNKTNQSLPIIGKIENVSSVNYLTFPDELKFSAIKTARYTEYQTLVSQPRIIKERFVLTPRLNSQIDVRIPIYLEQYGQYYAILEAQVDGEYNADLTLLEI